MRLTIQVVPLASSPSVASLSGLYTIEASRELPTVKASRTVKSEWLSSRALVRFNAMLRRYGRLLTLTHFVAGVLAAAVAFYPAPVGRWVSVVTTPLTLLPIATSFLGLRYDMVVLLLGTYDFWYQCTTCIVSPALLAVYTRDVRAFALLSMVPMLVFFLLADAHYRATKLFFVVSVLGTVFCLADAIVLSLSLVEDIHPVVVVHVYGRPVTAQAIIAHGFFVITITHAHNAFVRRHFATRASRATKGASTVVTTTVRCALLRCRLRWKERMSSSRQSIQRRPAKSSFDEHSLQLRCHGLQQVIDAKRTLLCRHTPASTWARLAQCELLISMALGVFSTSATFIAVTSGRSGRERAVYALGVTSLAATARVWLYFLCCVHQLDLLYLLHTNFDFIFIFVQLALSHLCLCDLSEWDARAFASIASLLWLHWAMLLDAVPPIHRRLLGLDVRLLAAAVQAAFLVALVLVVCDLTLWQSQRFMDREILHAVGHATQAADWSVGSFFLNRVFTLFGWLCRSLWRLATYEHDELVVLRGAVEYDDYERYMRQTRSATSKTRLQQITNALSQQSNRSSGAECSGGPVVPVR